MAEWIRGHDGLIWALAIASVVTFLGSLIIVPILIVRIPETYFADVDHPRLPWADKHPIVRWVLLVGKNALGVVFIVAAIPMLALPGQGILTGLIGIMLLNFPGKFRLERWLVTRRPVRRSIDWLRARAHRPPLVLDETPERG